MSSLVRVSVNEGLERLQVQMVATLLSTVLLGVYTLCVAYAAQILMRRGLTGPRRKLLYVIAAMYLATFSAWIVLVIGHFQTFSVIKGDLSDQYPSSLRPSTLPDCGVTVALTLNVVLGDGIVWWRVWVLWNKKQWILVSCWILLLATIGTGSLDSVDSCGPGIFHTPRLIPLSHDGAFFQFDVFGLVTVSLSLFSNTMATLLVSYKAWKHRRDTKVDLARLRSAISVQRTLLLLTESGIVYSLIWTLVLVSQLIGGTAFSVGMVYFTEGCLITLVGIYPTLIIIIVALDKSEIEKESLTYSIPIDRVAVLPSHTRISSSDTSACGDTVCTQSLAFIETPTNEVEHISGMGCADMEMKRAESMV